MSEPLPPAPPESNDLQPLPVWQTVSPALWAALFDPARWHESLEVYAHTTNLAVVLVDTAGRPLGPCLNPRPTWQQVHAAHAAAATAPPHADTNGTRPRCPFVLVPDTPCTCVGEALTQRQLVLRRDRAGLVHFTVPLLLEEHPVGALLAGQVFDQYPEQLVLEHVATLVGMPRAALWQVARLEVPVKRATLRVYGRLLAALGQAFCIPNITASSMRSVWPPSNSASRSGRPPGTAKSPSGSAWNARRNASSTLPCWGSWQPGSRTKSAIPWAPPSCTWTS